MRIRGFKISNTAFRDIIAELMWVSRETLDRDRLLDGDEYLEKARRIFGRMGVPIDYLEAEEAYKKRCADRDRAPEWR